MLVDTNVLVDVLGNDPDWLTGQLLNCRRSPKSTDWSLTRLFTPSYR